MKKFILILTVACSLAAGAQTMEGKLSAVPQTKEGKVVYERTVKMNSNISINSNDIPPEVLEQMKARLAQPRVDQYELLFTSEHSLYQYLPSAADDGGGGFGGGMLQMRMGQNDISYTHFEKGLKVDQREVMEKNYVVTDSIRKLKWKLSEETKPILNFTARKATSTTISQRPRMTMENGEMKREMQADTVSVVAWYTTEVPVSAGPNYAGQLPGLILEVDVNNGQNVIKAIEFSPKVAVNKIKEPTDGKKLTPAEFEKEREKMMKEMQERFGGQGGRVRIMQ